MVRQNFLGQMEFSDDAPIKCDCGCTVYPGSDVQLHKFDVTDLKANTKRITMTTCDDGECCSNNIFFDVLTHNRQVHYAGYTSKHIYNAKEERAAYEDSKADDYC